MAQTVAEQTAVIPLTATDFESTCNPARIGNTANIAYGGCASAFAVKAAFETLPTGPIRYHLYSVLGNYLGPALTDRKLRCHVRDVRTTRSFATRQLEVWQEKDGGEGKRVVMILTVDFHAEEDALLVYSAKPDLDSQGVESASSTAEHRDRMVKNGTASQKQADVHVVQFGLMTRFFEMRPHPESLGGQNLNGVVKKARTSQDGRSLTDKRSWDWIRVRQEHQLKGEADHLAALAFYMDGALSFTPLTHNHMFLDDAAACSTLECAFRIFRSGIDFHEWHFRETKTLVGAEGRTFSEGRLWDMQGNLVASMSQQSILRPKKGVKQKL